MGGGFSSLPRHTRLQSRIFLRVFNAAKLRGTPVLTAVQEVLHEAAAGDDALTLQQFLTAARRLQLLDDGGRSGGAGDKGGGVCSVKELVMVFKAHDATGQGSVPCAALACSLSAPPDSSTAPTVAVAPRPVAGFACGETS